MAITTLEQAIQAIEGLQVQASRTSRQLSQLIELSDEQLTAARQALADSEKAREWARNMYRVDHYGYIWKWNEEQHMYEKTTSRIGTPILADESVTNEKLADGAVEKRNVADGAVGWKNLDDALQTIISSGGGGGGIALSPDFGDSELVGITQKKITEAVNALEGEIAASQTVITNDEMDEVLGGDVAVYMTDSNGNLILDENNKPIELIP